MPALVFSICADLAFVFVGCCYSEVIKPDVLEELVLSATIHHLSLGNVVQNIAFHEQNMTDEFVTLKEIMSEVYKRLYALLRQLQARLFGLELMLFAN